MDWTATVILMIQQWYSSTSEHKARYLFLCFYSVCSSRQHIIAAHMKVRAGFKIHTRKSVTVKWHRQQCHYENVCVMIWNDEHLEGIFFFFFTNQRHVFNMVQHLNTLRMKNSDHRHLVRSAIWFSSLWLMCWDVYREPRRWVRYDVTCHELFTNARGEACDGRYVSDLFCLVVCFVCDGDIKHKVAEMCQ